MLGATGATGKLVVEKALAAGHEVTALSRRRGAIAERDQLRVVEGDASDAAAVAETVKGADAVISLLGPGKGDPKNAGALTKVLCDAMSEQGVRRLVAISLMGVGDSKDKAGFFGKVIMPLVMKPVVADRTAQEDAIRASGLDYTIVRPTRLTDAAATGSYKAGPDVTAGMSSKVSRADVADFLLKQADDRSLVGQAVSIVG